MNGLLLDTHIWIWFQEGDRSEIKDALIAQINAEQRAGRVYLSMISALEIATLVAKNRIKLSLPLDTWIDTGTAPNRFQLLPLTTTELLDSTRLPGKIHKDPADRILAAVARTRGLTLITRDDKLLAYGAQGHLSVQEA